MQLSAEVHLLLAERVVPRMQLARVVVEPNPREIDLLQRHVWPRTDRLIGGGGGVEVVDTLLESSNGAVGTSRAQRPSLVSEVCTDVAHDDLYMGRCLLKADAGKNKKKHLGSV